MAVTMIMTMTILSQLVTVRPCDGAVLHTIWMIKGSDSAHTQYQGSAQQYRYLGSSPQILNNP